MPRRFRSSVPAPTVGAARSLLAKAREELPADRRQAAEKGWLALVTAGRAMLRAAGEPWASTRNIADRVRALEDARRMSRFVSASLREIACTLHGRAFHAGEDEPPVEAGFDIVDEVINQVAEFARLRGCRNSA